MIKIEIKTVREDGDIEITMWKRDTNKDKKLFDVTINFDRELIAQMSWPEKHLGYLLNELETIEKQIEEEAENNEGDYDGSKEQAFDDLQRTEVAALKKQGY